MNNRQIKQLLNQAVDQEVPDLCDQILSTPVTPMNAPDEFMRQDCSNSTPKTVSSKKRFQKIWQRPALSFAFAILFCCLLLGVTYINTTFYKTDSMVSIDVNPSIELKTNKKNKVTRVVAKNKDAKQILNGLDLKNVKLTTAVNSIINSMLKNGYLKEESNTILISVSNKKPQKAAAIQSEVEKDIFDSLKQSHSTATIITQNIEETRSLSNLADEYHISSGKMQLIQQLLHSNNSLNIKDLADLSINELTALAQQYGVDLNHAQNPYEDTTEPEEDEELWEEEEDYQEPDLKKSTEEYDSEENSDNTENPLKSETQTSIEETEELPGQSQASDSEITSTQEDLPKKQTTSTTSETEQLPARSSDSSYPEDNETE